jgi:hypothetical protein
MMPVETLCADLHSLVRSLRRHRFPASSLTLSGNGLYFLFEAGETSHGGDRIVRVGSHRGTANLQARLQEHTTPNKDRSILRKNIGRALLSRARDPFLEIWNLDLTSHENRERFGARVDPAKQREVEDEVSSHIERNMSFSVIAMPDPEAGLALERLCIGTLSLCASCQAWS